MTEVCSIVDTNQFEPGKTVDACGFYAVASLKYAGRPGASPTGSAAEITAWADSEYTKYDGADVATNSNGMTMATLVAVILDAGLHYQVIGSMEWGFHPERLTVAYIEAWLKLGYPVVLAVAESTVYDQDLGGSPYAWDTSGLYHIIVAIGYDGTSLLCHDTASIGSSGVRPGPRRYSATTLQAGLTSATAIIPAWMTRPQGDFNPLGGTMIPTGWKDDGTTLTAPNGFVVVKGFRALVLATPNWDPANLPRENEQQVARVELHTNNGPGTQQLFAGCMLVWTEAHGTHMSAAGDEIAACYERIATQEAQITAQATQITALQTQLKAAQQPPIVTPGINVPAAIAALTALTKDATALKTALGVQ